MPDDDANDPWKDFDLHIPEIELSITSEEVKSSPRRLEHKDGTPKLYPNCWQGDCMKCTFGFTQLELF